MSARERFEEAISTAEKYADGDTGHAEAWSRAVAYGLVTLIDTLAPVGMEPQPGPTVELPQRFRTVLIADEPEPPPPLSQITVRTTAGTFTIASRGFMMPWAVVDETAAHFPITHSTLPFNAVYDEDGNPWPADRPVFAGDTVQVQREQPTDG